MREQNRNPEPRTAASPWQDEALASINHELRNGLSAILNALYVVRLKDYDRSVTEQALGTVQRQADALALLAERISALGGAPPKLPPAPGGKPEGTNAAGRRPCRVLVVDDSRDAADSTALLFVLWGHEVRVAYDGGRAVELAREFLPDVCLLDLAMPGMDGHELAARLRGEPSLDGVMLAAVTGHDRELGDDRQEGGHFDAFLLKPVEAAELRWLVQNSGGPPHR